MGAFGGHFGAIQAITGPPEALDQNNEAKMTWIPSNNVQYITIQYWLVPLGTIFGPIGVNLGQFGDLRARYGNHFCDDLTPFFSTNDFNEPKLFTGAHAINILNSGGHLGAFQVHFGLKKGVKSSPKWLQYLTLRPPNGPKFAWIGPKTVPSGP